MTGIKVGQWARRVYKKSNYFDGRFHEVVKLSEIGITSKCGIFLSYETKTHVESKIEVSDKKDVTMRLGCWRCLRSTQRVK